MPCRGSTNTLWCREDPSARNRPVLPHLRRPPAWTRTVRCRPVGRLDELCLAARRASRPSAVLTPSTTRRRSARPKSPPSVSPSYRLREKW